MNIWTHFYHPHTAITLLRITLAVLMLFHGWAKITGGVSGIEAMLTSHGLPGFLAYGVFIGEVIAPICMLVGIYVVAAACVMAINMLVALILVHSHQILQLNTSGGWSLELQAFFLVCALVVAMGHSRKK